MKNQKGFSLVELLVVVIIIAIVAAIAIPSLLASRRAANEASAISSLRTIHSANITYFATAGGNANYSPNLATLGPTGSGLIDATLATGTKSSYTFTYGVLANEYCAAGEPVGTGGTRSFGVAAQGVIYEWPGAGAAAGCGAATGILNITGATGPIQ